jgi:hypothetical protein
MGSNSAFGGINHFGPSCLETWTGRKVDLLDPDWREIEYWDVAHGLANTCRYGGHVERFYSVAEHSLLVADLLVHMGHEPDSQMVLAGLLHDAAEAYLGDVIAPLKWLLRQSTRGATTGAEQTGALAPDYDTLSERMDLAICRRFESHPDDAQALLRKLQSSEALTLADRWALRIEASALVRSMGEGWDWGDEVLALGGLPAEVRWEGGLFPQAASRAYHERLIKVVYLRSPKAATYERKVRDGSGR